MLKISAMTDTTPTPMTIFLTSPIDALTSSSVVGAAGSDDTTAEMEEEAASIKHEIEDGQMNTHNLTTEVKTRAKKRNSSTLVDFY